MVLGKERGDFVDRINEGIVSIILPCYNMEKKMDRMIEALLNQTYPNLELIFVNDGSTDAAEDKVLSYLDRIIEKKERKRLLVMSDGKILSISIAAYNMEQYLEEALLSLVDTTCIHMLDVIIVNDGSTDKTPEIATQYVEKYPDSFKLINKENGGYGSTINCALSHARGKYIKLLDGDDWYETKNIEPFLLFLQKSNVDMVLTQYQSYDKDAKHRIKTVLLPYSSYEIMEVKKLTKLSMHSLAVRTDLVRDSVTITEHCLYTDVEWWLKATLCCKTFVYLPIRIYCYRWGREGQSVSYAGFMTHIAEHEYISKLATSIIRENHVLTGLEKEIADIVIKTYKFMLMSRRNIQNIRTLFAYRDFLLKDGKMSIPYMNTTIRFILQFPLLMVFPYSIIEKLSLLCHYMKKHLKIG